MVDLHSKRIDGDHPRLCLSNPYRAIVDEQLFPRLDGAEDFDVGRVPARRDNAAVWVAVVVQVRGRAQPQLRTSLASRVHDTEVVHPRHLVCVPQKQLNANKRSVRHSSRKRGVSIITGWGEGDSSTC